MSNKNHKRRLVTIYSRRLQKLKEQQALKGLSTEPEILIEIEDIEAKLQEFQTRGEAPQTALDPSEIDDEDERFGQIEIIDNSGQVAFGPGNIVQVGQVVSGGKLSIGPSKVDGKDTEASQLD